MCENTKIYIEKMPEHIIRWDSLINIFPDNIKFLYIYRSWYEVALSIQNSFGLLLQNWYGYNSVKWMALVDKLNRLFECDDETLFNLRNCKDMFVRGVIEWIISHKSYQNALG